MGDICVTHCTHKKTHTKGKSLPQALTQGLIDEKKSRPCLFWAKGQWCRHGSECAFSHAESWRSNGGAVLLAQLDKGATRQPSHCGFRGTYHPRPSLLASNRYATGGQGLHRPSHEPLFVSRNDEPGRDERANRPVQPGKATPAPGPRCVPFESPMGALIDRNMSLAKATFVHVSDGQPASQHRSASAPLSSPAVSQPTPTHHPDQRQQHRISTLQVQHTTDFMPQEESIPQIGRPLFLKKGDRMILNTYKQTNEWSWGECVGGENEGLSGCSLSLCVRYDGAVSESGPSHPTATPELNGSHIADADGDQVADNEMEVAGIYGASRPDDGSSSYDDHRQQQAPRDEANVSSKHARALSLLARMHSQLLVGRALAAWTTTVRERRMAAVLAGERRRLQRIMLSWKRLQTASLAEQEAKVMAFRVDCHNRLLKRVCAKWYRTINLTIANREPSMKALSIEALRNGLSLLRRHAILRQADRGIPPPPSSIAHSAASHRYALYQRRHKAETKLGRLAQQLTKQRAFQQWGAWVGERRRVRALVTALQARQRADRERLTRRAVGGWRDAVAHKRAQQRGAVGAMAAALQRLSKRVLADWKTTVEDIKERQGVKEAAERAARVSAQIRSKYVCRVLKIPHSEDLAPSQSTTAADSVPTHINAAHQEMDESGAIAMGTRSRLINRLDIAHSSLALRSRAWGGSARAASLHQHDDRTQRCGPGVCWALKAAWRWAVRLVRGN
ncbi:unnamed protein product [Vitrella brassicaformis CCMP3155]|uniref:C3H1-type domain-containing protein n=4 Tax=Vitrella brassicaformis TaxID=1169539 RepID=A0A0G4GHX5_VITBC|nr:unnamed protein product [Vitrella brassicaformis CCMP3155]|eukprot:CEM29320.1 unnamed protein product [Vitrella brassicaformis CCMP3155]